MSKRIAIVGAGTAGLHLGLYLNEKGIDATIFTDRRPEEYANIRLLNTVAHHYVTIDREDALGINHWPNDGYEGHYYYVGIPNMPIRFYGDLGKPSRAVDYRILQPQMMKDFEARGGKIEYRPIGVEDLTALSEEYDLVVIGTGKGGLGTLFARDEQSSPFTEPQRKLCVGLFKGIAQAEKKAVTFCISPGAGEMIEIPTVTFSGDATALVMENHIGSDLEVLAHTRYEDDPRAFLDLMIEKLEKHYPITAERLDENEFDVANSHLDILQGGVTPTVRHGHVKLNNGKLAVLLGDAHATVDPVLGQGGNMASYAAHVLGEEIVDNEVYDELFCERVDARRATRVLGATRWTNFMLTNMKELPNHFVEFLGRVLTDQQLSDRFTENFNYPEKQWDIFSSPENMIAWIEANETGAEESARPFALTGAQ
ncbi:MULTISPECIES: styrene monooxygenase subunit StyA [unclassified Rhodococcus (in: high G+C Gram-positive bacteria)]|uniref:styrene monooxygenase subunit StyA n=1 Tax=unclassified Rhodococcus (in: high G+C Gram-positive bacteria) TaxID=192944 RepID=UPI00163A541D|nr:MULTISPECIES: styrene monooxygenase/indole monooxygenase family protein [unclassified Rhodococcus (in: high G+C Gram-positive bacteria)]MBC2641862.1 monooxygenase [Rhodococcus sp. 3A]MBC2893395.1 monooxygenase [Rhodococcus sp. 4CII]